MILADFECPEHGPFEAFVDADAETAPCPEMVSGYEGEALGDAGGDGVPCAEVCRWLPTPIHGSVRLGEVTRGPVAKPDSPMFLDTRALGEGMPMKEWKAKRRKLYEERRHKEGKSW